jgi:hypothetical protein
MGGACGKYDYKEWFDQTSVIKRALGKLGLRWESNIRADLKAIGWKGVDWINLAQDRHKFWLFFNTVKNFRFPYCVGNSLTYSATLSFPIGLWSMH